MRIFIAVFSLTLTACTSAKEDIQSICDLATKIEADSSIDSGKKNAAFRQQMVTRPLSSGGAALLEDLLNAKPADQYSVLMDAAKAEGLSNFDCPAWKKMAARQSDKIESVTSTTATATGTTPGKSAPR